MIFNFTNKFQFSTRYWCGREDKITRNYCNKWFKLGGKHCVMCKKAPGRMQLLGKVASLTTNKQDLLVIYKTCVRGALSLSFWRSLSCYLLLFTTMAGLPPFFFFDLWFGLEMIWYLSISIISERVWFFPALVG